MAQTLLEYSESGLGKTTSIGLFARHQFSRTGLPTRLITCDSGFGPCQPEVDEGIIIPICIEASTHPVPVINKLSKGFWPKVAINAKEGLWATDLTDEFVSITHATDKRYASGVRPLAPSERICGGYAVEGLTRICELVRKAWTDEQRNIGEPLQGVFEQQGEKFAFQSRGTLFAIQQLINNLVLNFRGLPVDRVLWTAHEGKGKDLGGRMVLGPATTGQALTDKVPGWFEIVLHHDSYQYQQLSRDGKRQLTKTAIRAWFQRHPDVELPKLFWPAKLGLSPELTGRMYEYFEEGYFPLIMDMATGKYLQGLHTLLEIIDNGGSLGEALPDQPIEVSIPNEPATKEGSSDEDVQATPEENVVEIRATADGTAAQSVDESTGAVRGRGKGKRV